MPSTAGQRPSRITVASLVGAKQCLSQGVFSHAPGLAVAVAALTVVHVITDEFADIIDAPLRAVVNMWRN